MIGPYHLPKRVSTQCDLVFALSVASILSFLQGHRVATYILSYHHFYSSPYFPFGNIPTQDVTNPISLPSLFSCAFPFS